MSRFRSFAVLDWSGGNDTGPQPCENAIWAAVVRDGRAEAPVYLHNRDVATDWIARLIEDERDAGRRLLIGFDFPFGYPRGFAEALTGRAEALAVWHWLADHLSDNGGNSDRFDLAGRINARFPGTGPFWFNGLRRDIAHLPRGGNEREGHGMPERREVETRAPGAFTCWQMGGAGSVGSQAMTGMAALWKLVERFRGDIAVWPFEPLDHPVAFVEVWPSLIAKAIADAAGPDEIRDAAQVRVLARALAGLAPERLTAMLEAPATEEHALATEEGWILGVGFEEELDAAARRPLAAPRFENDCFALPPGVDWTPVEEALDRLRAAMVPVTEVATRPLSQASGRHLAADAVARRSHPPAANSAVDGWGIAADAGAREGDHRLPIMDGRAAAGRPLGRALAPGHAVRILTGALLPEGVGSVVLDEDVATDGREIAFRGPVRPGANTRAAGEDVEAGAVAVEAGRRLGPAELALLAQTGVAEVEVREPLSVAVLSTGDEIVPPGPGPAEASRTYDANLPMLLSLVSGWGFEAIDLGIVPDDRDALRAAFDDGARRAHAVLTSGGASGGDEDHVSALLGETGSRRDWRIALKPGRPLVLGVWDGRPVFGLPGNPVAAMVCALIFARPALGVLAGGRWHAPQGFDVPAAFAKRKKPGRREYLRARLDARGRAEVFPSEGSGRVSSLAWAQGLVELPDGALTVAPGDPVRYLPFASFGP